MAADSDKFEAIDLGKFTLDDIMKIKNDAVRDVLVEMVRNPEALAASGHQNHGSHENHSTDASKFLETEFIQRLVRDNIRR